MINVKTEVSRPVESGIYSLHRYIYACQWLGQKTGYLVGLLLMRHHRSDFAVEDIEPGVRYVVAANHQTYLDPWVLPGQISWKHWHKMGTPRTFVANRFFGYPLVGTLMRSMGSFPAKAHPTEPYGLDYATYNLEHGHSIIIFPEGGISRKRERQAKSGVMVLARQKNVRIVPAHLEWRKTWFGFYVFDFGLGKAFDGSRMSSAEILDRIYDTPVK